MVVVRLPWEHKESDQPSFPTQTHCKHSHLKLHIQLEEWIHLPVLLDKCCTRYNTHSILYSVHLYFVSVCIYSRYFSEKITSACKKLKKESEHKNFLYTYSWTCHVLLIQMQVIICKNKNIEILQINYKTKIINVYFPHNHNIQRDVYFPDYSLENKKRENLHAYDKLSHCKRVLV